MRNELEQDAVKRALAPTAALLILAQQSSHGYALVQRLRAAGFVHVRGGLSTRSFGHSKTQGSSNRLGALKGRGLLAKC